jgi:cytochrome d ubiquinol oxidase subunit I
MRYYLLALGTNLSALWILIANAWMQNPVGASSISTTMRMEVTRFSAVLFNPVAQSKFVHTVSAGYVLGRCSCCRSAPGISCAAATSNFAKRSMTVAASFGLASALSVVVLGDESGYTVSENQKMKLAAIEAMWDTERRPASFTAFGFPDVAERTTHLAVHVPG